MRRSAEEAKARIIAAARERFGNDGYERATIRAIAADAAIDPAMVIRYFGSKAELFGAAADFDLRLPDLTTVPRGTVGRRLAAHFLDRWENDDALLVLLRAAVTNEVAAARLRAIIGGQVQAMAASLSGDPAEAPLRAGLIGSQVLGMVLSRYVLRLPPTVTMTHAEIIDWLGPTLQRYLTGSVGRRRRSG